MKDFLFGAATAAYQIEGGRHQDGRLDSIWDTFSNTPGNTYNGDTGNESCDHYNKMEEDVALMKSLGLKAYRFSVSWSRVLPSGTGKPNEKGLEFYDRLIKCLIDNDIVPCLTLYHWDLPQGLQDKGGWLNKDSIEWFNEYAGLIFDRYRGKVPYYITFNEINTFIDLGYLQGIFAPGIKDEKCKLQACHNVLLAHGKAVELFRSMNIDAKIGLAVDIWQRLPESYKDYRKAESENAKNHFWIYDAVFLGKYPISAVREYVSKDIMPSVSENDMNLISQKLDFFGLNYYSSDIVKDCLGKAEYKDYTSNKTDFGWKICPEGFYQIIMRVTRETGLPIIITENGMANDDKIINGEVNDLERIEYFKSHFKAASNAIEDGADVIGFMVWSLMDNFEWAAGYSKRFGIVYVDYASQKRTIKASGNWYRQYIKDNT